MNLNIVYLVIFFYLFLEVKEVVGLIDKEHLECTTPKVVSSKVNLP